MAGPLLHTACMCRLYHIKDTSMKGCFVCIGQVKAALLDRGRLAGLPGRLTPVVI